jgi:hypothetical protein
LAPYSRLPPPDVPFLLLGGWTDRSTATARPDGGTAPVSDGHDRRQATPHCVRQAAGRAGRKAPPAQVAIPSVIVTAKKPSKVAAERRYARLLKKRDIEEP